MRRREYLHSAVAGAGLAGLATTALAAAASDDVSPSGRDAQETTDTATPSPTGTATPMPTDSDATDEDSFEPLARLDVSNGGSGMQATEAVTAPDGRYAFVSKVDGFHVVDCDDPASPKVVATRDEITTPGGERLSTLYDVQYNRDRLLVAAERGSEFPGIGLFDVRDRTDPKLTATYRTNYPIHNCFLLGDHAYLTARDGVEIIDLAPETPERVGEWSITDYDQGYANVSTGVAYPHDLYVQDERLYVAYWDAGTSIVDVSDPSDPTHVAQIGGRPPAELQDAPGSAGLEPPGNDHYVQPNDDGTLLFVGDESWNVPSNDEANGDEDRGGPSGITIWNVEDPSSPTELATIDPPPVPAGEAATYSGYWITSHNFDVVGDTLYSSWYRGGVKVHDVSDPENPEELVHWSNDDEASIWTARVAVPGEFFVASSLRNPTDPGGAGGFYTFPDPTDEDATVTPAGPEVDISTPIPTGTSPAGTETASSAGTTAAASSGAGTTASSGSDPVATTESPTATRTGTRTATPTGDAETTTDGEGPGFGPLAAIGAVGVGAWRLLREGDTQ